MRYPQTATTLIKICKVVLALVAGIVAMHPARVAFAVDPEMHHIALYAGSTGTGVPVQAIAKVEEVERYLRSYKLANGAAPRFAKSFPGLEGEVLLCIELNDAAQREAMLADLRRLADSVALISIRPSDCTVR